MANGNLYWINYYEIDLTQFILFLQINFDLDYILGIPKMQIPALEPMVIPMLVVNRNEDALKVKATIKDVQAWGGSKFILSNLK